MRTEFASRSECKRYLTEYLGKGYDIDAIMAETAEWDVDSIVDGKATVYHIIFDVSEVARRYAKTCNEENFFLATEADFEQCQKPNHEPDYVSDSGSAYWYFEDGVVRQSDHWGHRIASCSWLLDGSEYGMCGNGARLCGFCEWRAFTKRAA